MKSRSPLAPAPMTCEIAYRGAGVRFAGAPSLVESLRGLFVSYGAEMVPAGAAVLPEVSVREVPGAPGGTPDGTSWHRLGLPHGGGAALAVPRGAALVHAGPPVSVVSVVEPTISVAQYGTSSYLPFVHYLVKYPLRRAVEHQGAVLAHSSAVEIAPGRCCLFLGPSGAGKTTVFVEMLSRGLRVLGNDATLLSPAPDEQVEAAAWPHVVRIGQETISRNRVLGGLPDDWAPRNPFDGKAEVFFDALGDLFGRPVAAPPARVTAVVDLALDPSGTGLDVAPLTPVAARSVLDQRLVNDRLPTGWLPGWSWTPDPAPVRDIAERFMSRTPVYRVRAGIATDRWADDLAEWVCALEADIAVPTP